MRRGCRQSLGCAKLDVPVPQATNGAEPVGKQRQQLWIFLRCSDIISCPARPPHRLLPLAGPRIGSIGHCDVRQVPMHRSHNIEPLQRCNSPHWAVSALLHKKEEVQRFTQVKTSIFLIMGQFLSGTDCIYDCLAVRLCNMLLG
jgi:hypothetical protein